MSTIWKEPGKDLGSRPNWNDQDPRNFKQCKMLNGINSPSHRRKTKIKFLLTQGLCKEINARSSLRGISGEKFTTDCISRVRHAIHREFSKLRFQGAHSHRIQRIVIRPKISRFPVNPGKNIIFSRNPNRN